VRAAEPPAGSSVASKTEAGTPLGTFPADAHPAGPRVDHYEPLVRPADPMPRHSEPRPADPYGARHVSPPIDLTAPPHEEPPAKSKKLWLAAAAVAVLAVAGISVPAARKLITPGSSSTAEGTLIMNTDPAGAQLFVDGVEKGVTPLTVALKPGPHSLEVRGDGAPRLMPITITAGAQVSQYLELPKVASAVGQLQVRTEPAGARVSVDGVARGTSPVTVADLAPGEHSVQLESDLGSVKQIVTIEAGNTAALMVPLGAPAGAPVSGWIALSAPAEVQLFENKRLIGSSQSDRLMVSAGRHEIEIISEPLGYRAVRTIQVSPGKVTPVKVEFPKGTIALNALPWAEVWVDGEKVGETPIGNLQVTIGTHDVLFRHPDLGEQRHKATVSLTAPARLSVDMRKK
jgi:PEGA domain-containing protein